MAALAPHTAHALRTRARASQRRLQRVAVITFLFVAAALFAGALACYWLIRRLSRP
jgi:heme/copper-type cytochrome/quinol oxidase subunit 3